MSDPIRSDPVEADIDEILRNYFQSVIKYGTEEHHGGIVVFAEKAKSIRTEATTKLAALLRDSNRHSFEQGVRIGWNASSEGNNAEYSIHADWRDGERSDQIVEDKVVAEAVTEWLEAGLEEA